MRLDKVIILSFLACLVQSSVSAATFDLENVPTVGNRWRKVRSTLTSLSGIRIKAKKIQKKLRNKIVSPLEDRGLFFKAYIPETVKGYERLMQKFSAEYNFDKSKITDIARMSLVFDDMPSLQRAYTAILKDTYFLEHFAVIKNKNRFIDKKSHYKDINLVLIDKEFDFPIEIQLHHACFFKLKKDSHRIYEELRSYEAMDKFGYQVTLEQRRRALILELGAKQMYSNNCVGSEYTWDDAWL